MKQEFDKIRKEIEEKVLSGNCFNLDTDYSRIYMPAKICLKKELLDDNDVAFVKALHNFTHYSFMQINVDDIKDFLKTLGIEWQGYYMNHLYRYYGLGSTFRTDGYKGLYQQPYHVGNVKNTHEPIYILVNHEKPEDNLAKCTSVKQLKMVNITDFEFNYCSVKPTEEEFKHDKLIAKKDLSKKWQIFLSKRYPELAYFYKHRNNQVELPEMTPELFKKIIGEPKFVDLNNLTSEITQ